MKTRGDKLALAAGLGIGLFCCVLPFLLFPEAFFTDETPSWKKGMPETAPRTVVGRVVGRPDDKPLVGATVALTTADDEFTLSTIQTDAEGHFRFLNLDLPTYYLVVSHPEHLPDRVITFPGKRAEFIRLKHKSEDPALMWAPDAPIEPALEQLLWEAVYEQQPFAAEYGKLKKLHSEYYGIESDEDDESGDYKRHAKYKALREAVEKDLPRTKELCIRGMIAFHAEKSGEPRLRRAVEWLARFRPVEEAFFAADTAMEAARVGGRKGTVSEAQWDAAFQAWSSTGKTWGEWKKQRDANLKPAFRALMELRAKQEEKR